LSAGDAVVQGELWMLDKLAIIGGIAIGLIIIFIGLNHAAYLISWKGVILYLGVPGSVLAAICLSFLLSRERRQIFFISALSLIVGAYSFEAWLWYDNFADRLAPDADRRTQLQVVQQHRQKGDLAFPAVSPNMISSLAPSQIISSDHGPLLPLGGVSGAGLPPKKWSTFIVS
jgi:hypothetical protein